MKSKTAYCLIFIFTGLILTLSCQKGSGPDPECETTYYIPESYLDWLPYYSSAGDLIPNKFFKIENKTFFLIPQELLFYNPSLDSQEWKLTYVTDQFNKQIYHGCPLYQEIKYTIYNSDIEQHIELGFVYRDTNYVSSSADTELYIPMIDVGACTSRAETAEGILTGVCYSTSFDINHYADHSKISYLQTFETAFATYEDVFLVKLNHNPESALDYDIYLSKNYGIVAFENEGEMWAIK